jgi:hypothetical protein
MTTFRLQGLFPAVVDANTDANQSSVTDRTRDSALDHNVVIVATGVRN